MSGRDFPAETVLVERGKYATLSSERRQALRNLQAAMTNLADYARRIMQHPEDAEFAQEQLEAAGRQVGAAQGYLHSLRTLGAELKELKPLAWGGKEPTE